MDNRRLPMKVLPISEEDNATYEVGFAKPPVTTRFKPGTSGNPTGRPRGSKNTMPSLAEERIKKLIMEEAYRTIPILEKGRRVNIPMITAVLRAVATNAAKGNNRAAILFTSLVSKTESENKKLASEAFVSALDYKDLWTKELKRRAHLGLKLPDPVPHSFWISLILFRNLTFSGPSWSVSNLLIFSVLTSSYPERKSAPSW